LIPVICLRNNPLTEKARSWRDEIELALDVIQDMRHLNPASISCYQVIHGLCGQYLVGRRLEDADEESSTIFATEESPQTQISNVYSMMWPDMPPVEADIVMHEGFWKDFLYQRPVDEDNNQAGNNLESDLSWQI